MRSNISTTKACKKEICFVSTEHLFEKAYVIPNSFYDDPSILPKEVVVYHPLHTWSDSVIDVTPTSNHETREEQADI